MDNWTINHVSFWGYFFTTLVVYLFALIVGGINNNNFNNVRPSFSVSANANTVLWAIALFVLALGTYYGSYNEEMTMILGLLFGLQLFFFIAYFVVFQRFADYTDAFWALVIIFILGLGSLWVLFSCGCTQAAVLVLLYVIWVGYELAVTYQAMKNSGQGFS